MKILIIEDSKEIREVTEINVISAGYDVSSCGDAEAALELMRDEYFPLIILDLTLPGMDGLEFCRRVRSDRSWCDIFILVMTGRAGLDDVKAAIRAGADDYLTKPFNAGAMKLHLTIAKQKIRLLEERKRMKRSLKDANERFRHMADNIDEVFWLREILRDQIIYVSPAYESVWGRSIDTLYRDPKDWTNAVHEDDIQQVRRAYEQVFNGEIFEQEYRIIRPDGTIRWIYDRGFPLLDDDKRCYRFAGIAADITKFKEVAIQLEEARNVARNADRAKSQFFANMSHELRTPLNGILGYGEMLQNRIAVAEDKKSKKYIDYIVNGGHRLLKLINDLLDLAALDADRVSCEFARFNVARWLETNVKSQLESLAKAKKIYAAVTVDSDVAELNCDKVKLEQVLNQLISNAVKFTMEKGRIQVHAEWITDIYGSGQSNYPIPAWIQEQLSSAPGHDDRQAAILFSVADTGIGVDETDMEMVFERFSSFDLSYARKHFGPGIGLAIAKRLVEMHGGQIWVESEGKDKGSVFKFVLPDHRSNGETVESAGG